MSLIKDKKSNKKKRSETVMFTSVWYFYRHQQTGTPSNILPLVRADWPIQAFHMQWAPPSTYNQSLNWKSSHSMKIFLYFLVLTQQQSWVIISRTVKLPCQVSGKCSSKSITPSFSIFSSTFACHCLPWFTTGRTLWVAKNVQIRICKIQINKTVA